MNGRGRVPAEDDPKDPITTPDDDTLDEDVEEVEEDTEEETTQDDDSEEDAEGAEDTEDKTNKDEDPPIFFDPKALPAELKPVWNKMQASFTQKMQFAAAVSKKAEAFDNLVKMPRFRAWLEATQRGEDAPVDSRTDRSGDSTDKQPKAKGIRGMIREELAALVKPLEERFNAKEAKEREKNTKDEFDTFVTKYPFYEPYKEDLREVLSNNPSLTYEQGLAIVVFPDLMKKMGSQFKKTPSKKAANITKPGKTTLKETTDPQSKSVWDAYKLARKQLGLNKS